MQDWGSKAQKSVVGQWCGVLKDGEMRETVLLHRKEAGKNVPVQGQQWVYDMSS